MKNILFIVLLNIAIIFFCLTTESQSLLTVISRITLALMLIVASFRLGKSLEK